MLLMLAGRSERERERPCVVRCVCVQSSSFNQSWPEPCHCKASIDIIRARSPFSFKHVFMVLIPVISQERRCLMLPHPLTLSSCAHLHPCSGSVHRPNDDARVETGWQSSQRDLKCRGERWCRSVKGDSGFGDESTKHAQDGLGEQCKISSVFVSFAHYARTCCTIDGYRCSLYVLPQCKL